MTNDQQQVEYWRDEFESGMKLNYPKVSLIRSGDRYFGAIAEGAYIGFLMAKRNQPVIEIPAYDIHHFAPVRNIIEKLTAAGYTYAVAK